MKSSARSGGKCWLMWKLPLWDEAVAPVRGCVCSWGQQTSVVCIERPSSRQGTYILGQMPRVVSSLTLQCEGLLFRSDRTRILRQTNVLKELRSDQHWKGCILL